MHVRRQCRASQLRPVERELVPSVARVDVVGPLRQYGVLARVDVIRVQVAHAVRPRSQHVAVEVVLPCEHVPPGARRLCVRALISRRYRECNQERRESGERPREPQGNNRPDTTDMHGHRRWSRRHRGLERARLRCEVELELGASGDLLKTVGAQPCRPFVADRSVPSVRSRRTSPSRGWGGPDRRSADWRRISRVFWSSLPMIEGMLRSLP